MRSIIRLVYRGIRCCQGLFLFILIRFQKVATQMIMVLYILSIFHMTSMLVRM